jgi:DNA-damage-inducible protein J
MAKDAVVRARIETDLKETVETIFFRLGLSTTDAINLFYRQVELRKGLPFPVEIPNEITLQTFVDTDQGKNLNYYDKVDNLFKKLDL